MMLYHTLFQFVSDACRGHPVNYIKKGQWPPGDCWRRLFRRVDTTARNTGVISFLLSAHVTYAETTWRFSKCASKNEKCISNALFDEGWYVLLCCCVVEIIIEYFLFK